MSRPDNCAGYDAEQCDADLETRREEIAERHEEWAGREPKCATCLLTVHACVRCGREFVFPGNDPHVVCDDCLGWQLKAEKEE